MDNKQTPKRSTPAELAIDNADQYLKQIEGIAYLLYNQDPNDDIPSFAVRSAGDAILNALEKVTNALHPVGVRHG